MSKYTGLYQTNKECFQYTIRCDGACVGIITPQEYNLRVNEFITKKQFENKNMIIVDKGRTINERSAI
jgi:DNA polymerase-3 subunit epsilon